MDRVSRLVVWIGSKFDREQIFRIISELNDILLNRNPEFLPKDTFFKKNIPTTVSTKGGMAHACHIHPKAKTPTKVERRRELQSLDFRLLPH
ncbi:MAG: hypothetical protein ONB44_00245 [candidate division KSB1 bacterium]|nr:hypothetical protein [candidate division KSB1 bacterium]MDZ7300551.1 hypothetical protein [candidate division KSB1 bacterium]MDZ7309690.1 hypothetical protein [candidate division KSB1 bacterium]